MNDQILIDGQDIKTITQDSLRRSIAFIPQEPTLFNRTIRENIEYGKPGATDKQIRDAARGICAVVETAIWWFFTGIK